VTFIRWLGGWFSKTKHSREREMLTCSEDSMKRGNGVTHSYRVLLQVNLLA
jgi:hypothetical protein